MSVWVQEEDGGSGQDVGLGFCKRVVVQEKLDRR